MASSALRERWGCFFAVVVLALVAKAAGAADGALSTSIGVHATKVTAWRVGFIDGDGDGADEFVYVGYGGEIICQKTDGKTVWESDVGGFPYHLKTTDLTGDDAPEILVSSSNLALHAFSADGRLLWRFDAGFPIIGFDVADWGANTRRVLVAGVGPKALILDANGNVEDEFPTSKTESRRDAFLVDMAGDARPEALLIRPNASLARPEGPIQAIDLSSKEFLWQGGNRPGDMRIGLGFMPWNADGDEKIELLETRLRRNRGRDLRREFLLNVFLHDNDGEIIWHKTFPIRGDVNPLYDDARLALADVTGDGRKEAVIEQGGSLNVVDREGNLIYQATGGGRACAFTDLAASRDGKRLLLGSVVGCMDRSLYVVEFKQGGRDDFAEFSPRHGFYERVRQNLRTIHAQALAARPDPTAPGRVTRIDVRGVGYIPADRLSQLYPYDNVLFYEMVGTGGDYRKVAHKYAESQRPHMKNASHGTKRGKTVHGKNPFEQMSEYFEVAGDACLGLLYAETSVLLRPYWRKHSISYVNEFMIPMMDVARKHEKDIVLWQKQGWFAIIPAMEPYREIFAKRFQPYLIARTEASNDSAPEINVMARLGLYRTGIVRDWSCNLIRDQWRTLCTCILEYDYNDPSAWLRQAVAYGAAGARDYRFQFEFGEKNAQGEYVLNPERDMDMMLETFVHLLGKGILVPPTPEEIGGLSPVVIRMREPHIGIMRNVVQNTEDLTPDPEGETGLLSGYSWWSFRPVHDSYLPGYALGVKNYSHDFIFKTPYGLPTIVPHWTPPERLKWASHIVDTDGVFVYEGDRKLTAAEAKPGLLKKLEDGAKRLPLRTDEVFCMSRRRDENSWRAVVVDPGIFDPAPRDYEAVVTAGQGRTIKSVTDVLSGEPIAPAAADRFVLPIPAGAFRIVDVTFN